MTLAARAGSTFGAVTSNGSTVCDSNRSGLVAIDASYTLTNNNEKIIYAAGAIDATGCRPRTGEGIGAAPPPPLGHWPQDVLRLVPDQPGGLACFYGQIPFGLIHGLVDTFL